jgi:hypothetical protein
MRDLAEGAEKGKAAMEQTAALEPAKFVAICASLIPKDVSVTLQTRLPGKLEPAEEYDTLSACAGWSVKALLEVDRRKIDVLQFVADAIKLHPANPVGNLLLQHDCDMAGKTEAKSMQNQRFA